MKRDSKLSLALHALGHMANAGDTPLRSEDMARMGATNPVVVRRVLGLLRQAGAISVGAVYRAVGEPFFARPLPGPDNPPHCAIERALHATMQDALARAEAVLAETLDQQTIADLAGGMAEVTASRR
jgi:DNA-binding IscR family transcriptional regulator